MSYRKTHPLSASSTVQDKGYQPRPPTVPPTRPGSDAGHQPATGHGPPDNPPNEGGSGKK